MTDLSLHERILSLLEQSDPLTVHELGTELGEPREVLIENCAQLIEDDLIRQRPNGYFLVYEPIGRDRK